MQKKLIFLVVMILSVFVLTGCWAGEVGVTTTFNDSKGAGTRTIILDVMDDTLSDTPIINPDDPDQTEGKGAVINNKHIEGGLPAIQTWLQENAPSFITVEEMTVDGYHRYFTLSYTFTDFDDFLAKYAELVNLSPNLSWDDFDATEKPTWTCEGSTCTFAESKAIVDASLDWAIDGVWNDIYVADDLAGYVTKDSITVLANYKVVMADQMYEELQHFDSEAVDGDSTGAMAYVTSDNFSLTAKYPTNSTLIIVIIAAVVVIGGGAAALILSKKKK
ncbi:MAG: hypothetical protein PHC62_03695 [Candidatus Izemoplasmatales bacterium]|nr:hypothetical protein [Candidatus Izemoplasmatales bacterium]